MTNRVIKFRAWDDYHKEMITPYCELRDGAFWGEDTTNKPIYVKHEHVMQFTGLLDKNEKEVFEGDVVRLHDHPTGIDDCITTVVFVDGCFVAEYNGLPLRDYGTAWTEVLGNRFEHPELLTP